MADEELFDLDMFTSMLDEDDFAEADVKVSASPKKTVSSSAAVTSTIKSSEQCDREVLEQRLRDMQAEMESLRNQLKRSVDPPAAPAPAPPSFASKIVNATIRTSPPAIASKIVNANVNIFSSEVVRGPTSANKSTCKESPKVASVSGTVIHTGDGDSSDEEERRNPMLQKYNEFGKFVKKRLSHNASADVRAEFRQKKIDWKSNVVSKVQTKVEIAPSEIYGGIQIMNPLISLDGFRDRMNGRKLIHMSSIRMHMRSGDIEGDWVTIGVVVAKDAKKSKKGSTFSIWKVCDLKDCNKLVSLFLFGKSHEQHWKTSVGSAVGILNASFMASRESTSSKDNSSEICLTLDNPLKLMAMGQSKDFGYCRSKRKDGSSCTMFVNKSHCEVCHFHVQKEYRKTSSKRMDLQASFSSSEPIGLRKKILQKQQVMYGGQMYVSQKAEKGIEKKKVKSGKDKMTLDNLKLAQKATDLLKVERQALKASHLPANEFDIVNDINDKCESFGKMLSVPSAGSRNLIRQLVTNKGGPGSINLPMTVSAKDLLRLQSLEDAAADRSRVLDKRLSEDAIAIPRLGKGFQPGQIIDLNVRAKLAPIARANLKAIEKIKSVGVIAKENPNAVRRDRTCTEFQENVKKRLASEESESAKTESGVEPVAKKQRTDAKQVVDTSSKEFLALLNRKSKYDNILELENDERQERYFTELEKKEQLETKMTTTMEVPCKAVSCKKCSYTALAAKVECRTEGHPLITHKAVKRFFSCKDCSRRTISLSKLPTRPCAGCGARNFNRVAMWKERQGPQLENEKLSIRGHESQSVDGFSTKGMI